MFILEYYRNALYEFVILNQNWRHSMFFNFLCKKAAYESAISFNVE